jgi:hypothetical protein
MIDEHLSMLVMMQNAEEKIPIGGKTEMTE